jgi:hypothetical protein
MVVKKLKTLGDGFAYNHYWPMWSQLLSEILQCEWQNFSLPGLGNEAISNIVLDELTRPQDPDTLFVIQWTSPFRLDLEINDSNSQVKKTIAQDPFYSNNYITTCRNRTYWSSSASKIDFVNDYRNLISKSQGSRRSLQQMLATTYALNNSQCEWKYIFTYNAPWAWHKLIPEKNVVPDSLRDFLHVSQYQDLDVGEIQPVTSVHLEFLEKFVLPGLDYDQQHFDQLKQHYVEQDRQRKNSNAHTPRERP